MRGGTQTGATLDMAPPLVVEVRDENLTPFAGTNVIFTAEPTTPAEANDWRRPMYVCATTASRCASVSAFAHEVTIADTIVTDANGQASIQVQFGIVAKAGAVRISVPQLAIDTLVPYTTKPGPLDRVVAAGLDTAVYVGASYPLNARAADRFGNIRDEQVAAASTTPSIDALANGTVSAMDEGFGEISLSVGNVRQTAKITVVPRGRLVAYAWVTSEPSFTEVVLVSTTGYDRRVIAHSRGAEDLWPIWLPGGKVVFQTDGLQVVDTLGGEPHNLLGPEFGFAIEPAYAQTSGKLYFLGTAASTLVEGIYMANVDGSSPTFLFSGVKPAASPDGKRVAYATGNTLRVRDMTADTTSFVAFDPVLPKWAPVGDLIAFTVGRDRSIQVVGANGTGLRTLNASPHDGALAWSPDGRWIVTSRFPLGLRLIRLSDGLVIPIRGTADLAQPAWQ